MGAFNTVAVFAGRGVGRGGWNDFQGTRAIVAAAITYAETFQACGPLYDWWQVVNLETTAVVCSAKRVDGAWVRDLTKKQAVMAKRSK